MISKQERVRILDAEILDEKKIKWETDFEKARERAKKENMPILLDFFNPG